MADETQEPPKADKPDEEHDLTTILSTSQCADLVVLIATLTERMRRSILENFYASARAAQEKKKNTSTEEETSGADATDADAADTAQPDEKEGTDEAGKPTSKPGKKTLKKRLFGKSAEEKEAELAKEIERLEDSAIKDYDEWRKKIMRRVGDGVDESPEEVDKQVEEASKGLNEKQEGQEDHSKPLHADLKEADESKRESAAPKLVDVFPRTRTSLTKLSLDKRGLILHSLLLLLLSLENYSARSRVLMILLTSSLKLSIPKLQELEEILAKSLILSATQAGGVIADEDAKEKRVDASLASRKWKIAAATAAGAAVIGISGGMAAPMVASGVGALMGGLGLGSTAAAGYLGAVAGSTYLIGGLFGAYGGRMTGQMMDDLSREVEDFAFLPVHGRRKEFTDDDEAAKEERRLRVTICITGWLKEKDEIVKPWRVTTSASEVFALRWELEALMNLGNSIDTLMSSAAWSATQSQLVGQTAASELMSSVMWPMGLIQAAKVVDNPFTLAKTRADKAGEVLADALINKAQGERAVSLIGYSLGARVIYSCLMSLAKRRAFGLVENAVFLGAPTPSDNADWIMIRSMCTGRVVNVYSENDRILAFLYRTSSLQYGVAGLSKIEGLPGVENVDVSDTVSGHLRYRFLVGKILQQIGLQDLDKEQLKEEDEAFQKMLEEEKEQDYVRQAKEQSYGYLGFGKSKGEESEKDQAADKKTADKEADEMEKEIKKKNEKSMMQWATEQLYISRASPSKPADEEKKDEAQPSADEEPASSQEPKSYYQLAKDSLPHSLPNLSKTPFSRRRESIYVSRSGSQNPELAKEGISEVGPTYAQQAKLYAARYLPKWITGLPKVPVDSPVDANGAVGDVAEAGGEATGKGDEVIEKEAKGTDGAKETAEDLPSEAKGDSEEVQEKAAETAGSATGDTTEMPSGGESAGDPSKDDTGNIHKTSTPQDEKDDEAATKAEGTDETDGSQDAPSDTTKAATSKANEASESTTDTSGPGSGEVKGGA